MINKLKELRAGGEEEGFTLIELMIVVVIIGILAAIAIPVFANQQKSAIVAGVKSDVKNTNTNIATALVKAPTSSDVNAIPGLVKVSSDAATVVTVAGSWDNYTVLGTNTGIAPVATVGEVTASPQTATGKFGIVYSSTSGKITQLGG